MNKIILKDGSELILDCVLEIQKNRQARTTKHKVEDGAEISDHIVIENDSYSIKGIFTDLGRSDRANNSHLTAINKLYSIFDKYESFKLATNRETKENLVITSISDTRNAETGNAFMFNLTVEQLRVAKSKTVTNNKIADNKTKDLFSPANQLGIKTGLNPSLELTNKTNGLISTNLSNYKSPFSR